MSKQVEAEIQRRVAEALSLTAGSVGVIVGTGLVLVKVATNGERLHPLQARIVVMVLTDMGLGGNLYHILP